MAAAQWDKIFPKLKGYCEIYQDGRKFQETAQMSNDNILKSIWEWFKQMEANFWQLSADQREQLQQLHENNYLRLKVPPRVQVLKPTPPPPQPDREQLVNSVIRGDVRTGNGGHMMPASSSSSQANHPPRVVATLSYTQMMGSDMTSVERNKKKKKPITKQEKMKTDDLDDVWWHMYALLLQYYDDYGDFEMEDDYIIEQDGIEYELGSWLSSQQEWLETYIECCPERYKKLEELMFTRGLFGIIEPVEAINNDEKLYFEVLGHEVNEKHKVTVPTTRAAAYLENPVITTNTPRHRLHRTNESSDTLMMQYAASSSSSNVAVRGKADLGQGRQQSSGNGMSAQVSRPSIQTKSFAKVVSRPVATAKKRKPMSTSRADRKNKSKRAKKHRRGSDSDDSDDESEDNDEAINGDESANEESDSDDEENAITLNESFWNRSSSSSMLRADNKDTARNPRNQIQQPSSSSNNGYGKGHKSASRPQAANKFVAHSDPESLVSEEDTRESPIKNPNKHAIRHLIPSKNPSKHTSEIFKMVLYHSEHANVHYLTAGLVVMEIPGATPDDTIIKLKLLNRQKMNADYFRDVFDVAESVTTWKMEQVFGDTFFYQIDEGRYRLEEAGMEAIQGVLGNYKMVRLP